MIIEEGKNLHFIRSIAGLDGLEIVVVIGKVLMLARAALALAGAGSAGGHHAHGVVAMRAGHGGKRRGIGAAAATCAAGLHAVGGHLARAEIGEHGRVDVSRGEGASGRAGGVGSTDVGVVVERTREIEGSKTVRLCSQRVVDVVEAVEGVVHEVGALGVVGNLLKGAFH